MKTQSVILIAVATILAIASHNTITGGSKAHEIPVETHIAFTTFIEKFNRNYATLTEYNYRLGVFHSNLLRIKEVNSGNYLYTAGINQFTDFSREEFRAKYLDGVRFTSEPKKFIKATLEQSSNIPASIDMRTLGAVNPIQTQGQCGSCWAFASTATMEASYKFATNTLLKFSEQQMVDCSMSYGNHGCGGGWMDRAYKYITDTGAMLASTYPYIANVQKCKYNQSQVVATMTSYYDITPNSQADLIAFAAQQTVATALDAQGLDIYQNGIFNGYCTTDLNHGVNIIGYGTSSFGTPYWLGRNCWGTSWGENGYFRIMRYMGAGPGWCGIAVAPSIASMV
jgi:C1A family cysteine protease